MADEELNARLHVEAVDDTGPVLRDIAGKIETTKKAFETIGSGLILGKAFNDFANYNRTLERLQFTVGATKQQMKGLAGEFDELAKSTGRGVDEIARGFNTYLDLSGQKLGPALEQFKSIADAAKVTGVSMEGLGRASAAAVNDMKVPAAEIGDLLNKWSVELPSTMLQSFSQMAPRIMQTMEAVGLTGTKNAEEIALAFSEISKATGNPRAAFMGLNSLLESMSSSSSTLGRMMLPMLQQMRDRGADAVDQFDAVFQTLKKMGATDPHMRPYLSQMFGIDFNTLKTMQTLEDHLGEIRQKMKDGESATQAMAEALNNFNNDPKSAIDHLRGSVEALTGSFAHLMVTVGADQALQGLAKTMDNVSKAIDYIESKASAGTEFSKRYNEETEAVMDAAPHALTRQAILGASSGAGAAVGFVAGSGIGSAALAAGGAGGGYAIGDKLAGKIFSGDLTESQLSEYAKRHGLAGVEHHASGGIVTRPTLSTIGEAGPEEIVPLNSSGGNSNVKATEENTAALNRLAMYIRDAGLDRRGLAYTPGAGELGTPASAELYGGYGGQEGPYVGGPGYGAGAGGGSGGGSVQTPLFRPGVGHRGSGGGRRGGGSPSSPPTSRPQDLTPLPQAGSEALASDRSKRFGEELKAKPWLADRIMQISLGENQNPHANQAVIETIFNRASARGQTLEESTREYTGRGSSGYYPASTFAGGARAMTNAKLRGMALEHYRAVLGGGNVSHYATDNSSQGLAYTERYGGSSGQYGRPGQAPGKFTFESEFGGHGGTGSRGMETFFSPGWGGGGRSSRARYEAWRRGLQDDHETAHMPEHQSMLEQHRTMRAEMERPIKMSITPPDTVGRRQRMQRIQSRMYADDMLGAPRYASQLDIGFA